MASQPSTFDPLQLASVVAWLEEQQKLGRAEMARLTSEVERLSSGLREQTAFLTDVRSSVDEARSALARLPIVDEGLRQGQARLAELSERLDSQQQQVSQSLLIRAAEADRDRKHLGDVAETVAELQRLSQSRAAELKALGDEVRHDRARLVEIPKDLDEVRNRVLAHGHRIDHLEGIVRRIEGQLVGQQSELEAIRAENGKMAQWRQLADVRWTRQVAEWHQAIETWRETAEEQVRPIQHLVQQVAQTRDEIRAVQSELGDQTRRTDDAAATLSRFELTFGQQREAIGRLEQMIDGQRRRFDEQASAQLRLDEAVGRAAEHRGAMDRALEDHTRNLEELRGHQRDVDTQIRRTRDDLTADVAGLRQEIENSRASVREQSERLEALTRALEARLLELIRAGQEHRQRLVFELERETEELNELIAQTRTA